MERRQQWLSRLESEFGNSPLVSNVAFGFILMGLEKLEFECPCDPKWNGLFSSAVFVVPAIMAFMLMLVIQDCRYDLSRLPQDGVHLQPGSPHRLADPALPGWTVIGIPLLIFICVGLLVYVIRESCQQEQELQEVNNTYEIYWTDPNPGYWTDPNPGYWTDPDPGNWTNPGNRSDPNPGNWTNPGNRSDPDPGNWTNPGNRSDPNPGNWTNPGNRSDPDPGNWTNPGNRSDPNPG
ncbi:unnamed protein product [Coregonus sp. 'balchen']|nr:unnamed protein product [Coregonus sp. 'balchen']